MKPQHVLLPSIGLLATASLATAAPMAGDDYESYTDGAPIPNQKWVDPATPSTQQDLFTAAAGMGFGGSQGVEVDAAVVESAYDHKLASGVAGNAYRASARFQMTVDEFEHAQGNHGICTVMLSNDPNPSTGQGIGVSIIRRRNAAPTYVWGITGIGENTANPQAWKVAGWNDYALLGLPTNALPATGTTETSDWFTLQLTLVDKEAVDGEGRPLWDVTADVLNENGGNVFSYTVADRVITSNANNPNDPAATAIFNPGDTLYAAVMVPWVSNPTYQVLVEGHVTELLFDDLAVAAGSSAVDADSDGLTEAEELLLGTDDTKTDSDGDGYGDKIEVDNGSDPSDLRSNPAVNLYAHFTATEGYLDGNLSGQNGWIGQPFTQVDSTGTGTASNAGGGYVRNSYGNGLVGSTGGDPSSAQDAFDDNDVVRVTVDYQLQVPSLENDTYLIAGFRDDNADSSAEQGFRVNFNAWQASTGGSVKFYLDKNDNTNADALIVDGSVLGLNPAGDPGVGDGSVDLLSDLFRVEYLMTLTDVFTGEATIDSLMLTNLVTSQSWSYSGATQTITFGEWEVTFIDCADGSLLNSSYFDLSGATGTQRFWYNVDGGGTAPADPGAGLHEIAVGSADTADAVATATQAVIAPLGDFGAKVAADRVTVTSTAVGDQTDPVDGGTGHSFTVDVQGWVGAPDDLFYSQTLVSNGDVPAIGTLDRVIVEYGSVNVDLDGDGLTAAQEMGLGTSDGNVDSDGDTFNDDVEVSDGTDPNDPNDYFDAPLRSADSFDARPDGTPPVDDWSTKWESYNAGPPATGNPSQRTLWAVAPGIGVGGSKGYGLDVDRAWLNYHSVNQEPVIGETVTLEAEFQFATTGAPLDESGTGGIDGTNDRLFGLVATTVPAWWSVGGANNISFTVTRAADDSFRFWAGGSLEGWVDNSVIGLEPGLIADTSNWFKLSIELSETTQGSGVYQAICRASHAGTVIFESTPQTVPVAMAPGVDIYGGVTTSWNGDPSNATAPPVDPLDAAPNTTIGELGKISSVAADNFLLVGYDDGVDTDMDNLSQAQEAVLGTSDLNADTDGDGHNDDVEVTAGTDPLDPMSYPGMVTISPEVTSISFVDADTIQVDFTGEPMTTYKLTSSANLVLPFTDTSATDETDGAGVGQIIYDLPLPVATEDFFRVEEQ